MRVLHIVPNMQVGGLETFIMNIYRHIDRNKIQFDFLEHYKEESAYDEEIQKLGGRIYHFTVRNDGNVIKYLFDLNRFFKEHKEYQVIHCHMESLGGIIFIIAKMHGVHVRIGHAHTNSTSKTLKGFFKRNLSRLLKYTTTMNLACSEEAGRYLFGNKPYMIVPNAVDMKKFKYHEEDRKLLRKQYQLENDIVWGHIGRMDQAKNQIFLIRLLNEYRKVHPHTKLVLLGEGEMEALLKKEVKKLKLENHVLFLGVKKDVYRYYSMFDLFLFPSQFEGLGIVLIEAQLIGLICLSSEFVPALSKISHQVKYLPLDIARWIKEIKSLKDYSHNEKFTKRKEQYDILKITKKIEQIYQ